MKTRLVTCLALVTGLLVGVQVPASAVTVTVTTERVSVANDGAQGNDLSDGPSVSADGRHVAFASFAWDLVNFTPLSVRTWTAASMSTTRHPKTVYPGLATSETVVMRNMVPLASKTHAESLCSTKRRPSVCW